MKKILIVTSMLAFALTMAACSSGADCKALCDEANKCDGATAEGLSACKAGCDEAEKLNDAAGCNAQYDTMLSCMDDNQDKMCDENNGECTAEGLAYFGCVVEYCDAHADDPKCQ